MAWRRKLAPKKYSTSNRRKPGRAPTVQRVARLVIRLASANPQWGYTRIHGELTKLGCAVAPSTIHHLGCCKLRASIWHRAARGHAGSQKYARPVSCSDVPWISRAT